MLIASAVALLATLLTTPLVRAAARRLGFLDHPGPRSSHERPTPRGGGVAILFGVGVALGVAGVTWVGDPALSALLVGGLLVAAVGLADDRFGLPPRPRLLVQTLAAAAVVRGAGGLHHLPLPPPLDIPLGPVLGFAVAMLWIMAVTNFFNFMDGIDGLAALQAAVTAGGLALAFADGPTGAAVLAAALAASAAAFTVYNWPPASVFLGDVGSETLGFVLASLALLAPEGRQEEAVTLVGASLFLFLADTTTCLLARAVRRERLLEAHRQHLYQRWIATGADHRTVSLSLVAASLVTTAVALIGWETGVAAWYWIALGLGSGFVALERATVQRRGARGSAPSPPRSRG